MISDTLLFCKPTPEQAAAIAAYRAEFEDADELHGCGSLKRTPDPMDWLRQVALLSRKDTLPDPEKYVVSSQYLCLRPEDGKILGMLQLRHEMNPFMAKYIGQIGYSVCPSERRKGVASWMLRKGLAEARKLGLDRVLLSCEASNTASRKTIQSCGGVYERTEYLAETGETLDLYWIPL